MKKNEYANVIKRNFTQINEFSTSETHNAMHKMIVQTRVKNGKYKPVGHLLEIYSEHSFNNILCGNDVEIEWEGQSSRGWLGYNSARIDVFEINRDASGDKFSRNIEVLVDHPHLIYLPNGRTGKKAAKEFRDYMFSKGYFSQLNYNHFTKSIRFAKFPQNDERGVKRLHFFLNPELPTTSHLKYGDFSDLVDIKTELERKYDLYSRQADKMTYVVFLEDLHHYVMDLKKMLNKKDMTPEECKIDFIWTLSKTDMASIIKVNGGKAQVFAATDLLKIPRRLKKKAHMMLHSIDELV
ncbi:MAG TPA: hypothetical protein ENN30_00945 [Candidatus Woesearchaeota archaeon]|nr:hypothetical protein [Candidatus Woesearchaeota archaeon]